MKTCLDCLERKVRKLSSNKCRITFINKAGIVAIGEFNIDTAFIKKGFGAHIRRFITDNEEFADKVKIISY